MNVWLCELNSHAFFYYWILLVSSLAYPFFYYWIHLVLDLFADFWFLNKMDFLFLNKMDFLLLAQSILWYFLQIGHARLSMPKFVLFLVL